MPLHLRTPRHSGLSPYLPEGPAETPLTTLGRAGDTNTLKGTPMPESMMTHPDQTEELPQHVLDEMSVLGALLLSSAAFDAVAGIAGSEHFYRPLHQLIYRTALDMRRRSLPVDAVTVAGELEQSPEWHRGPGAPYLHQLIATVPTAANADFYAERVVAAASNRMLSGLARQVAEMADTAVGASTRDAQRIYESARLRLEQFENNIPRRDVTSVAEAFQTAMDEAEAIQHGERTGIPTGFVDLDRLTGGILPGNLTLWAARPGVGKSAAVLNLAGHVGIREKRRVLIISVEMSTLEIAQRMACAEAGVRIGDMRQGKMADTDWTRLARAQAKVADAPLDVIADAGLTLSSITSAIRAYARQYPDLEMVVVDYIQRVRHDDPSSERRNDVLDISMALTELARALNIAMVCAAQLNRNSAGTAPRLHDLKESGQLEQDAALAVLVHRPDAENTNDPRMGEADFLVPKNRFGPTGAVTVAHQLHYGRFVDMAAE